MIEKLYNDKTHSIKWDSVLKVPEFDKLRNTPQCTKWHGEGDVIKHTKLVIEALTNSIKYSEKNKYLYKILMLSALFHDIGKGVTTCFNSGKQDWSSPNHDVEGEIITRKLLEDDDVKMRECICFFVKNHMKPLYVANSVNGIRDLITLSNDGLYPDICTVENLILLKSCDCLGSIMEEDDGWEEKLALTKEIAIELDCLNKPYPFKDFFVKYRYFNHSAEQYPDASPKTKKFKATIFFQYLNCLYIDIADSTLDDAETIFIQKLTDYINEHKLGSVDIPMNTPILPEENTVRRIIVSTKPTQDLLDFITDTLYEMDGEVAYTVKDDFIPFYLSPTNCFELTFAD